MKIINKTTYAIQDKHITENFYSLKSPLIIGTGIGTRFNMGDTVILPIVSVMNGFFYNKNYIYGVHEIQYNYVEGEKVIFLRRCNEY